MAEQPKMNQPKMQIREGAGLEESRLNTEFIDLLRKFSTPLLLCIAVVAGGYFLYGRYTIQQEKSTDEAYAQLDAAAESRNPTSLLRVAEEHTRGAVPFAARMTAADIHLDASRTGVPIGTTPEKDGSLPKDTVALTPEQRLDEVKAAEALYKQVLDSTISDNLRADFAMAALHGLGACAESRGDLDAAKAYYQQIVDKAKAIGQEEWARRAEKLKSTLDDFKVAPKLYEQAQLPASAIAIQPYTSPMMNTSMKTATGETFKVGPDGKLIQVQNPGDEPAPTPPGPEGTPAPVPTPAPGAGTPPATTPPATAPAAPATTPPASPAPTTPPASEPPQPK